MSSPNAIEIPPATLEALRGYAEVRRSSCAPPDAGALIGQDRPLTAAERTALLASLEWWRDRQSLADSQVRTISARLRRP